MWQTFENAEKAPRLIKFGEGWFLSNARNENLPYGIFVFVSRPEKLPGKLLQKTQKLLVKTFQKL